MLRGVRRGSGRGKNGKGERKAVRRRGAEGGTVGSGQWKTRGAGCIRVGEQRGGEAARRREKGQWDQDRGRMMGGGTSRTVGGRWEGIPHVRFNTTEDISIGVSETNRVMEGRNFSNDFEHDRS
jgi:hypothetical protein